MDIDLVRLTMNQTSINILKVIIAFLMFAVALELKLKDFQLLLTKPKAFITGTILHLLIFPIVTYIFILSLDLRTSLALGLIMLVACPVGNLANLVTVLAKGNIALSVGLTSFTNLLSLITTPLYLIYLGQNIQSTKGYLQTIQLDQSEILQGVFLILGLPVMLGMITSKWRPHWAEKIQVKLKKAASAFLLIFILAALAVNFQHFIDHAREIFAITFSYHLLILIASFLVLKVTKINSFNVRAIYLSSLLKNTGLALSLTLQFFPLLGGMALLVAFATISQLFTGFALVKIFNWKKIL